MFNPFLPSWSLESRFLASLVLCAALLTCGCGSSAETITFSSPARCGTQAQADTAAFGSDGGAGVVRVTTSRECQWSAKSEVPWVTLLAPASGQGEGSVRFTITSNPDPQSRAAAISVEDQRLQLSQEGRRCEFKLSSIDENVEAIGGQRTVQVSSASTQCRWSAAADVPWIEVVSGAEGSGSGAVTFRVEPVSGSSRTGTIRIAGQVVEVEQVLEGKPTIPPTTIPPTTIPPVDQGSRCSYEIGTTTFSIGAGGGTRDVPVSAAAGCAWTAQSQASWISVTAGASSGTGGVAFRIDPTDGPARTGTLSVAGRLVTVAQSSGCSYSVEPLTYAAPASGGSVAVTVRAASGCPWKASTDTGWIGIAPPGGAGPAQVVVTAPPNQAPARVGSLMVAGQVIVITQPSPCAWVMAPASHAFPADGGNGNVLVVVTGACTWTAASNADWITMTAGTTGTGNSLVQFTAAPNPGSARTGSITIAGQRYEVVEAGR